MASLICNVSASVLHCTEPFSSPDLCKHTPGLPLPLPLADLLLQGRGGDQPPLLLRLLRLPTLPPFDGQPLPLRRPQRPRGHACVGSFADQVYALQQIRAEGKAKRCLDPSHDSLVPPSSLHWDLKDLHSNLWFSWKSKNNSKVWCLTDSLTT